MFNYCIDVDNDIADDVVNVSNATMDAVENTDVLYNISGRPVL